MNRRPTFFIVGVPKAGTTALSHYLERFAGCFMAEKELHYFNTDMATGRWPNVDSYLAMYADATEAQPCGDASVWYLYSNDALKNIRAYDPASKIIVLLRNPVTAAQALHGQHLLDIHEDEPDFETAWRLQEARKEGKHLPVLCPHPAHLHYRDAYIYAPQLQRLFDTFPREQIKIFIYEEFFADPQPHFDELLGFLDVEPLAPPVFSRVNESRVTRSVRLARVLNELPARYPKLWGRAKRAANAAGLRPGAALHRLERRLNLKLQKRPALSPAFAQELRETFAPSITDTEEVLGRSIAVWRIGQAN